LNHKLITMCKVVSHIKIAFYPLQYFAKNVVSKKQLLSYTSMGYTFAKENYWIKNPTT